MQTVLSTMRGKKSKHGTPIRSGEVTRSRMRRSGAGTQRRDRSAWGGAAGEAAGSIEGRRRTGLQIHGRAVGRGLPQGCPARFTTALPRRAGNGTGRREPKPFRWEELPTASARRADGTKGQQPERCFTGGSTTRCVCSLVHSLTRHFSYSSSKLTARH